MTREPLKVIRHVHLMAMRYGVLRGAILYSESYETHLIKKIFPDTKGGIRYIFSKRLEDLALVKAVEFKVVVWLILGIEP